MFLALLHQRVAASFTHFTSTICKEMTRFFASPTCVLYICVLACFLFDKGNADCKTMRCRYHSSCKHVNGTARCMCDFKCDAWMSPICGSDGMTYGNECLMRLQSCRSKTVINTEHLGSCVSTDSNCLSLPPPPKSSKYIKDSNGNYYVVCLHGFFRQGDARVKCRNGTWEMFVSCHKKACSHPGAIENGKLDFGQLTFGSKVSYDCDACFYLDGPKERECLGNESWSGIKPICKPINCGHILEDWELENGIAFGHDTYCGSAIEFECLEGYELIGSPSVVCQEDGKWSTKKPECRSRATTSTTSSLEPSPKCAALDNPVNGQLRDLFYDEVYRPGHEVIFECDDNYKLTGTPIVTCLESGNWSHPSPSCALTHCNDTEAQAPVGGYRFGSNLIGDSLSYFCKKDRKLIGPTSIHCRSDGTWSKKPPVCKGNEIEIVVDDTSDECPQCNDHKDICKAIELSNFTLVGKMIREDHSSYRLKIKKIIKDSKEIITAEKDAKIVKASFPRCVCFPNGIKGDIIITGSYVISPRNDLVLVTNDDGFVGKFYGMKQIRYCL